MAMLTPETIYTLNALLEEERASVHSAVALAGGATEYVEREAFSMMGREDVEICVALRERLSQANISPSRADDFAATRFWENGRKPHEGQGGARMEIGAGSGAGLPDSISADPGSQG